MWSKMGPVLIIEAPAPGPQIAKDVNVFHIWKTYYLLFFFVVLMSPVWWGLHDTLVPKNYKEVNNKFSSDYFHILHVVGG